MPSRLTVVLVSLLLVSPVLIFWLSLLVVPARVAEPCPVECDCKTGADDFTCRGQSLTAPPLLRFLNIRVLWLHKCNITLFERNTFFSRGLTELESLWVVKCGLRTIEVGAFNGLTKLRSMFIKDNELREIIPGTFQNMSSLKYLEIVINKLQHLDINTFSGLVNLKEINFPDNELQYVHPDTFLGLPNLQSLSLNSNPTLQIPTDGNFINSHSLLSLDISGCNISSLSVETFADVSALELLDLSDNNLTTVDINTMRAMPKLSEFYVHDNPLYCDCQLQEVWRWCEDHNIQTSYWGRTPKCDTPSEVKAMGWGVLEKGQCFEGKIHYNGDYNTTDYSNYTYRYKDRGLDQNTVIKQQEFFSRFLKQYQVPAYAVPFIFGTISNVIVLIIIICNKDMRTVPNMYILNLATSNIIYLTVLFSEACANRISDTWLEGDFMCTFLPFCRQMSVCLSAYSVAVYIFQRYRIIKNPFQFHVPSPPTLRVIVATISGVWIVAALFAIPSAVSKYQCEEFAVLMHITYLQLLVVFELLVSCVLPPLCVISFTYITTARHLVESSRSLSEGIQNPQLKTRRNTAKIVVGLTVLLIVSYVPYHAFWTYVICTSQVKIFSEKITDFLIYSDYKLRYTYQISTFLLLINSCLNPVALLCTSSPFRQHLKRYLTRFCKQNSPPAHLELARRH